MNTGLGNHIGSSDPSPGKITVFFFRGTATELLVLLTAQRHPAGKGLSRG